MTGHEPPADAPDTARPAPFGLRFGLGEPPAPYSPQLGLSERAQGLWAAAARSARLGRSLEFDRFINAYNPALPQK